ncbi:MAG TPA: hypothetical protein VFB62_20735, partial [Polyangiaceae bacterium]|nr:hypothetical protein [Polyangiaceae bacterium]
MMMLAILCAIVAVVTSLWRLSPTMAPARNDGVAKALGDRGLRVDRDGVLWLGKSSGLGGALFGQVPVVVRAAPGPDEPHDIYLVIARLSPDGVLLSVGRAYNLTETSAVDEQRPVGQDGWFAFTERPLGDEQPSRFRLVDLLAPPDSVSASWTPLQKLQASLTRLQQTGRLGETRFVTYAVEPPPPDLKLEVNSDALAVKAAGRTTNIIINKPLDVPSWLSVEPVVETRPGNLVTWGVDLVREEIGDEAMQYIKAIFFSALDVVLSGKEDLTGDDAAEDIAADLGEDALPEHAPAIAVDPDIGFPPPKLEPWVKPALPGEGEWVGKDDDPFIHTLPG